MTEPTTPTGKRIMAGYGHWPVSAEWRADIVAIEQEAASDAYASGLLDGEGQARDRFAALAGSEPAGLRDILRRVLPYTADYIPDELHAEAEAALAATPTASPTAGGERRRTYVGWDGREYEDPE